MEITDPTPAENDTALAQILNQMDAQRRIIDINDYNLRSIETQGSYADDRRAKYQAEKDAAQVEIVRLITEKQPYEAHWAAKGWQRYYLVTNGNGHVHTSTACSTCFITTQFAWLPECSGMTEAELVEEFGERVCTVCCPTAPVTPGLVGRRDREAQDSKAAEKAAKRAAKLEKALLPTGEPLRTSDGEVTTLIAAQRLLSHHLQNIEWYGTHPSQPKWEEDIALLVPAISAKTGTPEQEILETAKAKAAKKVAKEKAA